jgi:hypothetical protein
VRRKLRSIAPEVINGLWRYAYDVAVPASLIYALAALKLPAQLNWAFRLARVRLVRRMLLLERCQRRI